MSAEKKTLAPSHQVISLGSISSGERLGEIVVRHAPPVEYVADPDQFRFKDDFPALADTYDDPSSIITELSNYFLDKIAPFYLEKIEAIKKRKKLSINSVMTDKDVMKVLAERDKELRRLQQATFKMLLNRRPGGALKKRLFLDEAKAAAATLRDRGEEITKKNLAETSGYSTRNLRARLQKYGMTWEELLQILSESH